MKLDDLGRRAADEVREATRQARFSAAAPESRRPLLARPAAAVGLVVVLLAVGLPLLFVLQPWGGEVREPGPTTTSSTTVAPTTTLAAGETPVASVEELVPRILAALTAGDAEALRGLFAGGSYHSTYTLQGGAVLPAGAANLDTYQPGGETWEVLGEVMVAGKVAATPVQVTYATEVTGTWRGFDVIVVQAVAGGFLGGSGLTLLTEVDAPESVEADPAVVVGLLAAQAAAWAAGDVDGVLADYSEQAKYIDGSRGYSRDRAGLPALYSGLRLEFTGEPVISGPFFTVATRVTDLASGVGTDGVSAYWIRDGQIALHVLTTGT